MSFQRAAKSKSKLRLALFGPSGAGKTMTALRMATGMGGKIALIDTEHGSASKYADRFTFDTVFLDEPNIENVVALMAEAHSYDVLIIDSLSHAWKQLLEQVDKLAKAKFKGNTWSAWSEGTPLQNKLIGAILHFPGHIIATMRSKTEWESTKDDRTGSTKPVRVGLAPEQGKGIEYEFDLLMEISVDHIANVIKDRTGRYQDKLIEKPSEAFGKELADWLNEGEDVAPQAPSRPNSPESRKRLIAEIVEILSGEPFADEDRLSFKAKAKELHTDALLIGYRNELQARLDAANAELEDDIPFGDPEDAGDAAPPDDEPGGTDEEEGDPVPAGASSNGQGDNPLFDLDKIRGGAK